MDCLAALVKQILQHFCKGFWVCSPAEDLRVVVVQVHSEGDRFQALFHAVESLDPVLEDQVYILMDSKVTCEELRGDVLAHLDWNKCLFSCSSVHPRTSLCKGRPHCFPSPQI